MTDTDTRQSLYSSIHKALRFGHANILASLGSTDWVSKDDTAAMLEALATHLSLCAEHLEHEDNFFHPMIKAASTGTEAALEDEHEHHAARMQALTAACERLHEAADSERPALGYQLYLDFTAFMAADFEHMAHEETIAMTVLWDNYSEEELNVVHERLVGSIHPARMMLYMQLMLPAIDWRERHGMLKGMRMGAPEEAFNAIVNGAAKPTLKLEDWQRLVDDLGLAA